MLTNQTIDPSQAKGPPALLRPFVRMWHWLVPPSQAHRDRESATAAKVRTVVILVLFGGPLITGAFFARDLRRMYKDWRADGLVRQARKLADDGNVVNAVLKAQEAYNMSPENTEAIRLNAEFFTLMKREEAVYFHGKLEKSGKATVSDRQGKVRALLGVNRGKEASDTLEELMRSHAPNDAMFKLAEEVWGVKEKSNIVLDVLAAYCEKNPGDLQSALRLAKFRVASESREVFDSGMEILWRLTAEKDEIALQAADVINGIPQLSPDDARRVIQVLESHPRSDGWRKVSALRRKVAIEPAKRPDIIREAVFNYRQAKREDRVAFVRWLVEEREFHQVLAVVDEEDALAHRQLLENYLNALTFVGRFDDLQRLVKDKRVAEILDQTMLAFYNAHLAFVTGKPREEVRAALIAAKVAADDGGRTDVLLNVAAYCELRGYMDVAEDSYRAVCLKRKGERSGYEGLVRCTNHNGNIEGLIEAAREAVRRWPDDEKFLEHYLYANILAGSEVELSLERVLKLLERRPDDSVTKIVAALGYYRLGDLDMSINHMQRVNLNDVPIGMQIVFGFMAKLGGYFEALDVIIKAIPNDKPLLPQERIFLDQLKKNLDQVKK